MPLPFAPAIPWVLVVWTIGQGGSGANQTRYYESQHDCLVAKQAVVDLYASVKQDERHGFKITAACMPLYRAPDIDVD
jgi:hypothetical protein